MHRDLTGNNLVLSLLAERRQLKKTFEKAKCAKIRWKEINDTLKEIMGNATIATLPGWRMEIRMQKRKEYTITVPEQTLNILCVKWEDDPDEEE